MLPAGAEVGVSDYITSLPHYSGGVEGVSE